MLIASSNLCVVGNDVNATITLSVGEYPPGYHNITINIRDIYGQTANKSITGVYLIRKYCLH